TKNSARRPFDAFRALFAEPVDHLFEQIASDLRDTRRRIEIGEMSLREAEITVETVQKNLKCVLERLQVMLPGRIFFGPHFRLRFQCKRAHIREEMAKKL